MRKLIPIAGSCLAACKVREHIFFGTAAEPSPVNMDPYPTLYGTKDGSHWEVIHRWKADNWSRGKSIKAALFQMARIIVPAGENNTEYLFATTIAVTGDDGTLHRWKTI